MAMQVVTTRSNDSVPGLEDTLFGGRLQRGLARFNARRLRPCVRSLTWREDLADEFRWRLREAEFVEAEREALGLGVTAVPQDADAFVSWFEALRQSGPGQGDALFPFLAERATLAEMRWFLSHEIAGEAGFDDLVAMTQVKFDGAPKLELANNYWDEMGRGNDSAMHGPMLKRLSEELGLEPSIDGTVWESLALGNLMVALASNRGYAYHSIGALGVIELTAPGRAHLVNEGLKRLGISAAARRYFALHATLDVRHSAQWNREVIRPLVSEDPRLARPIAEGALLRLRAGERTFARYRAEFGL